MSNGTPSRKQNNTILLHTDTRTQTRRIVFIITTIIIVITVGFLAWSLRSMILPFIVGTFAAYMCFPLLKSITRIGVPRPAGILILFGAFFLAIVVIGNQIGSIIPDKKEQLVLRTRFQYKLNERYRDFMGLGKPEDNGNMIYKYFGDDFDRFMKSINNVLRLDKDERRLFAKYHEGYQNEPPIKDVYYQYFLKNTESAKIDDEEDRQQSAQDDKNGKKADIQQESHFTSVMAVVKLWIIMPLVFLFLLIDDGEIKRFFIGLVPNRYFEVSLAVFDKVNKAIGNYLRGILIECSLVGISYLILLILIGFEIKMAIMIGLIAGIANAVPLLGPAIAFGIGASYALIAEDVSSIMPFITTNNLFIAVAACVLIVMILDNAVFQPFVVGGAVQIHPLAVFIGIIGGSMLFGFAGLILAIPTIVVAKELMVTLFRELKDYYII
jgi:predicted PurR-regulated permease PerM